MVVTRRASGMNHSNNRLIPGENCPSALPSPLLDPRDGISSQLYGRGERTGVCARGWCAIISLLLINLSISNNRFSHFDTASLCTCGWCEFIVLDTYSLSTCVSTSLSHDQEPTGGNQLWITPIIDRFLVPTPLIFDLCSSSRSTIPTTEWGSSMRRRSVEGRQWRMLRTRIRRDWSRTLSNHTFHSQFHPIQS